MCLGSKKLVILGIPWDVDSEGLRRYMSQFGELVDVMVMKDRASGRSRGFGYATFSSSQDAEKALTAKHIIGGRTLEIKVATPKEEMGPVAKKATRIFVARIPSNVSDEDFHSYFMKYGPVVDAYMPKDPVTKHHRGIAFVTYENSDSVDKLMSESHELGGSTVAVDRATPKEDPRVYRLSRDYVQSQRHFNASRSIDLNSINTCAGIAKSTHQPTKLLPSNAYLNHVGPIVGSVRVSREASSAVAASSKVEKKLFIGRVPMETKSKDLQAYFTQFGSVVDVYLPKDSRKTSHRGFAFVTFADEASAARVARLRHFIHGREIAVDSASPTDHMHGSGQFLSNATSTLEGEQDLHCGVAGAIAENSRSQALYGPNAKWGKKLFIGRIPIEATAIDLILHFNQFGNVLDVYLPKDDKKTSHRGFGFVTFADEISAEYASQKVHRILGQRIVLDRAAPLENEGLDTCATSPVDASRSLLDGAISPLQNLPSQQLDDAKIVLDHAAPLENKGLDTCVTSSVDASRSLLDDAISPLQNYLINN